MSIKDNIKDFNIALEQAYKEYPPKINYSNSIDTCDHNYNFIIYCDNKWDIVRCLKCGSEKICRCTFDDEYK